MTYYELYQTEWFLSVPPMTGGAVTVEFKADDRSCVIEREGVAAKDFYAYVEALAAAGFVGGENYTMGENLYALRHGEVATVYVAYSAKAGTIRLYAEEKGHCNYPAKGTPDTHGEYEPTMWQLTVDNKGTKQNGGMSYVYLLADGTFMVIDGGYDTYVEAKNLYDFLKSHTPEGKKTVITAWYFSHLHGDHFGAMRAFAKHFAEEVEVKSFYYHFALPESIKERTDAWSDAVHYARLHSGMEFNLPGVNFRVLYTMEDLYPVTTPNNINESSTVIRATVAGQGVMFLGDIEKAASDCIMKYVPNDVLRTDIVQYAHHGYEGGSVELYDAIAAPTVLWPMSVDGYQENYYQIDPETGHSRRDENGERIPNVPQNVFKIWHDRKTCGHEFQLSNYYICYEASYVKQIITQAYLVEMHFPYTPTDERLPDLDAIFADKTKDYKG